MSVERRMSFFSVSTLPSALEPSTSVIIVTSVDDDVGVRPVVAFRLEVDTTINNESVASFSAVKQLNLRLAFAALLVVPSSSVAIMAVVNVIQLNRARHLDGSSSIDVLIGIEFGADRDINTMVNAVVALFASGSLAAYMQLLGTPMEMVLNNIQVQKVAGNENDDGTNSGNSGNGEDGDDGNDLLHDGSWGLSVQKESHNPTGVIAGAVGGFVGISMMTFLFVHRRRVVRHFFTRIVPAPRT